MAYPAASICVVLADQANLVPFVWAVGMFCLLHFVIDMVRSKRAKKAARLFCDVHGDKNLICRGNAWELRPLENIGPEFFEPVIIAGEPPWLQKVVAAITIPLAAGIYGYSLYKGWKLSLSVAAAISPLILINAALRLACQFYYRVQPGRLYALSARLKGAGVTCRAEIPLQGAKVECSYPKMQLLIRATEGPFQRGFLIDLQTVREHRLLVEAVFRGVLCDSPAPVHQGDALIA